MNERFHCSCRKEVVATSYFHNFLHIYIYNIKIYNIIYIIIFPPIVFFRRPEVFQPWQGTASLGNFAGHLCHAGFRHALAGGCTQARRFLGTVAPWQKDKVPIQGWTKWQTHTGWWFGTWLLYAFMNFHILGSSSSQLTNSIIFQRGRYTTNQHFYWDWSTNHGKVRAAHLKHRQKVSKFAVWSKGVWR